MFGLAIWILIAAFSPPVHATQFLDDFEGDGEVSRIPATSLRNWDIITSVDLYATSEPPHLCHRSGSCIDLVGTAGARTGGIISKQTWPLGDYVVGFFLYGSGRDPTGAGVAAGGTVSRLQVSFGGRSIYANNHIASDFNRFVVLHVRGSGKLRFLGTGEAANIGPLVDNALVGTLTPEQAEGLIADGTIFGGMVPKVRTALGALDAGVAQAVITNLDGLRTSGGTVFTKESI